MAIKVTAEHMRQLRRTPVIGLLELVKNALDSDATTVHVTYATDEMDGIREVTVTDDGTGMSVEDVRRFFPPPGPVMETAKRLRDCLR